jgi:hypothetical protein
MRNEYRIVVGRLKATNCFGEVGIDGKIILKWFLNKYGVAWSGFVWLGMWSSCGGLWFNERRGIYCVAERLPASQKRLSLLSL